MWTLVKYLGLWVAGLEVVAFRAGRWCWIEVGLPWDVSTPWGRDVSQQTVLGLPWYVFAMMLVTIWRCVDDTWFLIEVVLCPWSSGDDFTMRWRWAGNLLVISWQCSGDVFVMLWPYVGLALVVRWYCFGDALVICLWAFRDMLVMFWWCLGDIMVVWQIWSIDRGSLYTTRNVGTRGSQYSHWVTASVV